MPTGRPVPCVLLVIASLGAGCGGGASGSADGQARGQALFGAWSCGACHGEAGQGTEFGPSLQDLRATWTEEDLARFLADPQGTSRPHLLPMRERFPAPMPGFSAPEEDRRALAAWLLRDKGGGGAR